MKKICDMALEKGYAMSVEIETEYDKRTATFDTGIEGKEIEIVKFKNGHYVYYKPQLVSFAPPIEKLFESETKLLQYLGWVENDMKETYYIVEVNDGIYLEIRSGYFDFTDDVKQAYKYKGFNKAVAVAEKSGGIVKKYLIKHEILPCDEVV